VAQNPRNRKSERSATMPDISLEERIETLEKEVAALKVEVSEQPDMDKIGAKLYEYLRNTGVRIL